MSGKIKLLLSNMKYPGKLLNLAKMRKYMSKEPDRPGYLPMVMDIEPNVKCNLSCRMCQVASWDRMVPDLTTERFVKILEEIPTLMKIKLQGMGEPFLNRDLLAMAEIAADSGINVVTNSNGTLFDEELSSRIVNGRFDIVSISVDGATSETYEAIRIGGRFGKVKDNIKRLVSKRGRAGNPEIEIWMVGMRENIHELPDMVRLCSDLGIDRFNFQHDVNFWGKDEWAEKLSKSSLVYGDREVIGIIEKAESLARELGLTFNIFRGDRYSRKNGIKCGWPWESAYITADGYVCPCCITCDPRIVNFGNVFEKPFAEIWKGNEYAAFRRRIRTGDLPVFCRNCYID